ncbi:hypothetical protein M413DRAFT_29482 [Hebeloma cylindrosporum]|uniref:non-specific serine/threonine protein kinase n=1 Tax=Hebeloma cylindrosporum TaxID=76867 RepID=A0A0C2YE66_HEBCY|nr:hypothetical protein M413DRAFT_29482 [Hebeloma cylindrosporum h7]
MLNPKRCYIVIAGVGFILHSGASVNSPAHGARLTAGTASLGQNFELAHTHRSHLPPEVFYNRTFVRVWAESGEELGDGVKFVHHANGTLERIILRPRGSRTLLPLKSNGRRGLIPSKSLDCSPPIDIYFGLGLWFCSFLLAAFCGLYILVSLEDFWLFLVAVADIWHGFLCAANSATLRFLKWALPTLWLTIGWTLATFQSFLMTTAEFIKQVISVFRRLRLEWELRQWERRNRESITRKQLRQPVTRKRPSPQHSTTPLFQRGVNHDIYALLLPEELPKEQVYESTPTTPMRHMYDPWAFNHVRKIGSGSFGNIIQVEHRITGKMMALKRLIMEENSCDDVHLEVRALLRVQRSHWYPKVLSTFMDGTSFYILMPFYERGDLYRIMYLPQCGGCLPRTLAQFYLAELFLAIQYIHKMGIIHRDLKPDNLLISGDGHLIVADFGVAHVFPPEEEEDPFMEDEFPLWAEKRNMGGDHFPLLTPSVDNPHTITGVAGTLFYAAPEVVEGHPYSYGVDFYSMAMLYHEMVTGYAAFGKGATRPGSTEPEYYFDLSRKDVHPQPLSMADLRFMEWMTDRNPYYRPSVVQMKAHPVFAGMQKLANREVPIPPIFPLRKRVPFSASIERYLTNVTELDSIRI